MHRMNKTILLGTVCCFTLLCGASAFAFYNPSTGKWLNRDPVEERGGTALYLFCNNETTSGHDADGRITVTTVTQPPYITVCGSYKIEWSFALDNPPKEDGYIVQKVTYEYHYTDTEDTEKHETTDFTKVYWEAWF